MDVFFVSRAMAGVKFLNSKLFLERIPGRFSIERADFNAK
jgi:hypothetical protein